MPRSRSWINYAVCLLALGLYVWSYRGLAGVGALPPPPAAVLHAPATVAGVPAASDDELRFLVQGHAPGSVVQIAAAGVAARVPVVAAFSRVHRGITLVTCLFFLSICLFIFAGRAHVESARVLFWGALLYGLAISTGTVYFPSGPLWPDALRPLFRSGSVTLVASMFVHLGLVFPRRRPALGRRPWLLPAIYLAAALMILAQWTALLHYLADPGPAAWRALAPMDIAGDAYLIAAVFTGSVLLAQNTRAALLTRERQQVKWVWWGITVGTSPYVFLYTLPRALGLPEIVPLAVARLFALVVPTSFGFAVARYQFMDIDLIIRRSLIYGTLAGLLVGVYLAIAALAGRQVEAAWPAARAYLPFAAALVSLALFAPTRRWIGLWVDRTFFKIRYDYAHALSSVRGAIAGASGQAELAQLVLGFLRRTLSPQTAAVALRSGAEVVVAGNLGEAMPRRLWALLEPAAGGREGPIAAANATSLPELERADFPPAPGTAVRLAQPLVADGRWQGVILLGAKESERRYIEQDLELLAELARATAAALERMDLVQKVAEETIVRRRLDELNRLKSDFLSRVAHDLRTPLTSIAWSTDNLLDGVAGPIVERQGEYLQSIRVSARQLRRLVDNLLEIARLEEGKARFTLTPVELAGVVAEAAAALAPIAAARAVRVRAACDVRLGPVCGDREKLLEVVINLLENAVRYSPGGEEVCVQLVAGPDGCQELTVRDRGPGVPAGEEEAIFERFRQGAPSPYSPQQGFGLGLHVVRSYVELFGGTVRAENPPEGGARFTCRLKEWTEEAGA